MTACRITIRPFISCAHVDNLPNATLNLTVVYFLRCCRAFSLALKTVYLLSAPRSLLGDAFQTLNC